MKLSPLHAEQLAHMTTREAFAHELRRSLERDRAAWERDVRATHGIPDGFPWAVRSDGEIVVQSAEPPPPLVPTAPPPPPSAPTTYHAGSDA